VKLSKALFSRRASANRGQRISKNKKPSPRFGGGIFRFLLFENRVWHFVQYREAVRVLFRLTGRAERLKQAKLAS